MKFAKEWAFCSFDIFPWWTSILNDSKEPMSLQKGIAYLLLMLSASCVDRINIYVGQTSALPLVIDGFISAQPGPYTVKVNSSFDTESSVYTRIAAEVRSMIISDNVGNYEQLKPMGNGVYQTLNFQGVSGRVYKLQIELFDGKQYESLPDTLLPAPKLDSVWYELNDAGNGLYQTTTKWGFDVLASSATGESRTNTFSWTAKGTFRVDTHPELINQSKSKCYPQDPDNNQCSFIPPCSGLYNQGTTRFPAYVQVKPCSCCTCWYDMFNPRLTLSDNKFRSGPSRFPRTVVYRVPVSGLILMYKIHVEVSMQSMTAQTYGFWKIIKNQQEAVGSIFQPITGKIASQFVQVKGPAAPITGIFYAAGIAKRSLEIKREHVVPVSLFPEITPDATSLSCLELFPNATTVKPDFWFD